MKPARSQQNGRREYRKTGDSTRKRQQKERDIDAIDGRTIAGKPAKNWRRYALKMKGGESCPTDTGEKIDEGTFCLWRALKLRSQIILDEKKRGALINRRRGTLPKINEQYDTLMEQWRKINDELELDKPTDLARRLMEQARANER